MKSKNNVLRKFLSVLAVFILAVLASLTMFSFKLKPSYALSVDNSNFSDGMTDNTSTPSSPNSYTFVNSNFKSVSYNPQSTSADQPKITAGVVNIEDQGYTKASSGQDDYALMISSKKGESSYTVKYGYTSTEFKLEADSYYQVAVDIYTDKVDGLASLYLVDENSNAYSSYEHIGKANTWTTFMFIVKTNDLASQKLKLALFLDGNGTVLFDSVRVVELTSQQSDDYQTTFAKTSKYVAPTNDNLLETKAFTKTNLTSVFANSNTTRELVEVSDGYFDTAIKITNSTSTYSQYTTADDFLTFEQNRVYRVTFNVKTTNLSGKVSLRLVQTGLTKDDDGNDVYDTDNDHTLTISSNTSSSVTNDFSKYSFYVNSHPLKTTTFKLVVSFGDSSANASGEVYITGAIVTSANYSHFEEVSTGSTAQKINLASKVIDLDSDTKALMITNGNFNTVKTTDYTKTYPVAADSWTVKTGTNSQLYGIVNTKAEEFEKFVNNNTFTGIATNPGKDSESNNVLMMYNSTTDTLSYASATDKALDAKTYHRFSLNVLTQRSALNIYLVANINDREVVLSSIKNVTTDGNWHNVDLYIYTGIHTLNVGVKVEMKTTGYGFAYLDDATFDFALREGGVMLTQPTETQFNDITAVNYGVSHIAKVDLSNLLETESTGRYSTPLHFNENEQENVDFGIIDLTNEEDVKYVLDNLSQNYQNFVNLTNKNVLAIHAKDYISTTYFTNLGYRFESNKYYVVSVKVYTQHLQSTSKEFGLGLALENFEGSFKKLNTETETENGWKTYKFYINPTDATTSTLQIIFGNSTADLKGDAFIGDISIEEVESKDFITKSTDNALLLTTPKTNDSNTDDNTKTDDKTKSNNTAWIIAIPTILTGLAIILAVVGVTLRKVKFKKRVKKTKNAYDRNSKQSQQIYMRKATTMREERLRELNKQLETLQAERAQYEEQYKKDLSTLRQLKIKRAPANEISKLEKDMKLNQKHSSQIGSSIRNIELEIEYTNSNDYIQQAVKKLSSVRQEESQEQE
mgnify:FL=1